ncbi:MAG: glycosyl transferase family 1 [Desulfurococcales archaeon ex4484_58]|nr:MAG: glycosyl transferase family 1 [Desulfurococcales archaeon ex4484_58]
MVIVSITPEIYLEGLNTYAGGLGVLEGDKFYGAGDLGLDYIVFSLMYRRGYVDLEFRGEEPITKPQRNPREGYERLRPDDQFSVHLRGEEVIVQPWIYRYRSARAVLFEAVCPMWARSLTDQVYIEESNEHQFLRYSLLAKATYYYIKNCIGLENISVVDLEEAHTSLILFIGEFNDKFRLVIHTPGPWGHPGFPGDYIAREFGVFIGDYVSLTEVALEKLGSAIVVSEKQKDILSRVFPKYNNKFKAITNGIYLKRWMHPDLYRAYIENKMERELLVNTRAKAKKELEEFLNKYKELEIGDRPVIAWVRRLSRYKRPYLIAKFIEEHPELDVVYVLGGKPHPRDKDGLDYARWFRRLHLRLNNVVYVHEYSVEAAQYILRGSDLLLYTPFSGWEACGTSYMKSLVNGVPILSSRDGGVIEIVEDNVNSWLFGEDIRDFINIYTDERAGEIDERDYSEFSYRLLEIINSYGSDKYWDIAYNAYTTIPGRVDIKNVLKKYYID